MYLSVLVYTKKEMRYQYINDVVLMKVIFICMLDVLLFSFNDNNDGDVKYNSNEFF